MGNVHYTLVDEVCAKNPKINFAKLQKILERINKEYSARKEAKQKVDFRTLWAPAIVKADIEDLFESRRYTEAVARYYQLRRKPNPAKLRVLARDMEVLEMTTQSARVQVTSTFAIIFRTHNAYGTLKARDLSVDFTGTTAGTRKPALNKNTYKRAKNKAKITINNLRKRVQKTRRKK